MFPKFKVGDKFEVEVEKVTTEEDINWYQLKGFCSAFPEEVLQDIKRIVDIEPWKTAKIDTKVICRYSNGRQVGRYFHHIEEEDGNWFIYTFPHGATSFSADDSLEYEKWRAGDVEKVRV